MQKLMGCTQPAAKWTIQVGERMKKTAGIKDALLWRKEIEQREHGNDHKPGSEPIRYPGFRLHAIHGSVVPNRQNAVKLGKFITRDLNFQKKLASTSRCPNIAFQFRGSPLA